MESQPASPFDIWSARRPTKDFAFGCVVFAAESSAADSEGEIVAAIRNTRKT